MGWCSSCWGNTALTCANARAFGLESTVAVPLAQNMIKVPNKTVSIETRTDVRFAAETCPSESLSIISTLEEERMLTSYLMDTQNTTKGIPVWGDNLLYDWYASSGINAPVEPRNYQRNFGTVAKVRYPGGAFSSSQSFQQPNTRLQKIHLRLLRAPMGLSRP